MGKNVAYITGVLIECIVFPTLIDQFFCFRFGVVEFHGLAQFTGGVRVPGGRCDSFSMPFGVIFPSANKKISVETAFRNVSPMPTRWDRSCPPRH